MAKYFLIADIGGTNTNMALVEFLKKEHKIIFQKSYPTITYTTIEKFIDNFMDMCSDAYDIIPENGLFAVAGAVENNRSKLTNSDLVVDAREITKKTRLENVSVINDFSAISYSLELIQKKHIKILNKGRPIRNKPFSILGAGTGLGKSIVICNKEKKEFYAIESEGGHADFVAYNDEERELFDFIKKEKKRDYIVVEDIVSGSGIESIYKFLQHQFTGIANGANAQDISDNKKKDPIARKTFKYFYKFYARAAKNFVLESFSLNGIYLAGGIIEKNIEFSKKDFMQEFTNNNKFEKVLREVPIYIIKDYDISLLGLINYILRHHLE